MSNLSAYILSTFYLFLYLFLTSSFVLSNSDPIEGFPKLSETKKGQIYYAKNKNQFAEKWFLKAIEKGPISGHPYFFMGMILDYRKEYAESSPYFEQSLSFPMKREYKIVALWKIIFYFYESKIYDKVFHYIEKLESLNVSTKKLTQIKESIQIYVNPKKQEAMRLFISYDNFQKQLHAQKNEYITQKTLNNSPLSPSQQTMLNQQFYKEYVNEIQQYTDSLYQAISLNPSYISYAIQAGILLEKTNLHSQAISFYQLVYQSSITTLVQKQQALYKLGVIHKKQYNYSQAIYYLESLLTQKIHSKRLLSYIRLNLAQALYAIQNYLKAYKHLESHYTENTFSTKPQDHITALTFCLAYSQHLLYTQQSITESEFTGTSFQNCSLLYKALLTKGKKNKYSFSDFLSVPLQRATFYFLAKWYGMLTHYKQSKQGYLFHRTFLTLFYLSKTSVKLKIDKASLLLHANEDIVLNKMKWIYSSIQNDLEYMFFEKDYILIQGIYKHYSSFFPKVFKSENIIRIVTTSYLKLNLFKECAQLHSKIQNPLWYDIQEHWLCLLKSNSIQELANSIYQYTNQYPNQKKQILSFIQTHADFIPYYNSIQKMDWVIQLWPSVQKKQDISVSEKESNIDINQIDSKKDPTQDLASEESIKTKSNIVIPEPLSGSIKTQQEITKEATEILSTE